MVKLIRSTKTSTDLKEDDAVDANVYRTEISVSQRQLELLDSEGLGELLNWNYVIQGFKKKPQPNLFFDQIPAINYK